MVNRDPERMDAMYQKKGDKRRLGERLVAEFSELRDALRSNSPLSAKFTVRTVELDLKPKQFDAESVRMIRFSLGVSQPVFAHLLNVSVDLVQAWEQGHRIPDGPAGVLLEMMEIDKKPWLRRLSSMRKDTATA
jgi:DNA-binding transcriptional regulator YiaG